MGDIERLQKLVIDFRDARDWKQFHNAKDISMSLVLEATELMENFQWKNEAEIKKHLHDKKADIPDELADVFYWVLLIAHDFNIDLTKALEEKMAKNNAKYPVVKSKGNHKKYSEL